MEVYKAIVRDVLERGIPRKNRTGIDTISLFGVSYSIELEYLWPVLTLRELPYKAILAELRWFLSGETAITRLNEYTSIWKPWADEHDEVPSAYGAFWRNFNGVDQIKSALRTLISDPDSRRIVVTAWDPANALQSKLPPCHMTFVFGTEPPLLDGPRKLNLHLFQRSCDIGIGLPWNIACYTAMMHLFAKLTRMEVGKFVHSIVDAHIYVNHETQLRTLLRREPRSLPILQVDPVPFNRYRDHRWLDAMAYEEFIDAFHISGDKPWPAMKFDVAV